MIGQDTRESSAWIADRVTHGLTASGIEVHSAGVITTPGVAYLARSRKYAAGVVISASHNPWTDNGIKVFSGDGYKLPDAHEMAIEQEIFALLQNPEAHVDRRSNLAKPARESRIAARLHPMAGEEYKRRSEPACECWWIAPMARPQRKRRNCFALCGIQATFLSAIPDGKNINESCGALHPETLAKAVAEKRDNSIWA